MNKLSVYERQKKICLENRFLYDEMTKVGNVSFIQKLERRVGGGKGCPVSSAANLYPSNVVDS